MGRIATINSFNRALRHGAKVSDVLCDPGGNPNITCEHFSSPGDDAYPVGNEYIALVTQEGSGRESVVGYIDPKNLQKALKGEKRIYGRDSSGDEVCEIWQKNDGTIFLRNDLADIYIKPDGTILLENSSVDFTLNPDGSALLQNINGFLELQTDGEFLVNDARITTDGDFITASGVSLDNHPHNQGNDSNGDSEAPTDPPTATE